MPSRLKVPREFKFWDEQVMLQPFTATLLIEKVTFIHFKISSWSKTLGRKEFFWNILNQSGSFFHLLIFPIICRNPIKESTDVLERLMSQRNPATRFVESEKITVRKGRKVKNLSIRTKSNTAWRKTIGISQTLFSAVNQEREKLQKIAQVWLKSYEAYHMTDMIWLSP